MPVNITVPSQLDYAARDARGKDLGYTYPKTRGGKELDLRPGSELHERIKNKVSKFAQDSYSIMQRKHSDWNLVDQTLTAYIPLDDKEKALKQKDPRKPVSIVIPYSYATMETLLTYLTTAFLDLPIFRYEGVTSEDTVGTILLEKVIEMQTIKYKAGLALHTLFRDGLAYGFGACSPVWAELWGYKTTRAPDGTRVRERKMLFEGSRIDNIDPYLYLPDTSVPIHQVQRGEFVGWLDRSNLMSLLDLEANDPVNIFNIKFLKGTDGRSPIFSSDQSKRDKKSGINTRQLGIHDSTNPVDVIWMYVMLVPSDPEWQLGDSDIPEKWIFGLAADQFIITAREINLDHDMYPTCIFAPDYDGYSVAPVSRLELIYGMQNVLDFLFSSHVENIRKAINDMLIVDPFLVNMADLESPEPGKLIKTRRAAWGRGVKDVVAQLTVNDITKSHISQDVPHVTDLIQRTSGAVDSLMGVMRSGGERRSATESRDSRMSALSRLAKTARICSLMTMYDLGYMFASHTQQLMSESVFINTMGRYQQELIEEYGEMLVKNKQGTSGGMKVSPEMLDINYDTMIHDGTVDVGERAESWVQLFQVMSTNPAVGSGFDMIRVFKHLARLMGAKNVNEFIRKGGSAQIQTMQNQQVMSEVQKGNMVPINNELGGGEGEV